MGPPGGRRGTSRPISRLFPVDEERPQMTAKHCPAGVGGEERGVRGGDRVLEGEGYGGGGLLSIKEVPTGIVKEVGWWVH